ncbi:MAG: VWA domain-containing protein [Pseudomonadota bacterium]
MTDPLDDLKRAMDAATPAADPARRAANLEKAQEIFDRAQGSRDPSRLTSNRPKHRAGFLGVRRMFAETSLRPIFGATTALVAVGVIALTPQLLNRNPSIPTLEQAEFDATVPGEADDSVEMAAEPVPVDLPPVVDAPDVALDMAPVAEAVLPPPAPTPVPSRGATQGTEFGLVGNAVGATGGGNATVHGAGNHGTLLLPDTGRTLLAPGPDLIVTPEADTEAYANEDDNPVQVVAETPVSTFSIDVDTASYSVLRSWLNSGQLPPAEAVRIEELINYFDYDYAAPGPDDGPFQPNVTVAETPWNPDTQLLTISLQGEMPVVEDRPPLNLVFLIDTSGSMGNPDKLPLLIQSFRMMVNELRPEDEVAIVTYAGSAGLVLEATPAAERTKILAALDNLQAGGSTAGQAGLIQAYNVAEEMAEEGDVTRVILATDGDFNVGIQDPDALETFISDKRDSGTYLSVLGFGRGNLNDAVMQSLAQSGNGTASYIDTLNEARKVLVDQLTGALFPIANDVKIQVEFNPAQIAEYRLIGYETRALNREDFNNDQVDAGEIGAGHSVTAIYEIVPVGSPAILSEPLRYGGDEPSVVADGSEELAFLRLRFKNPGEEQSQLMEFPIVEGMGQASIDTNFAAAIAGFGQLLKGRVYTGDWSYADAIALAQASLGDDEFGYRRQAVDLMRLAESLSQ